MGALSQDLQNGDGSSSPNQMLNNGQYLDILVAKSAKKIIAEFVQSLNPQQLPPPTTTTTATTTTSQERITIGLAAFNAFLQANVTGPALDNGKLSSVEKLFLSSSSGAAELKPGLKLKLNQLRKTCLASLEVDGVGPYPHVPLIELFCLARHVLLPSGDEWLALRIKVWHFKLLTRPVLGGSAFTKAAQWCDVPTLQGGIERGMEEVEKKGFGVGDDDDDDDDGKKQVKYLVEKANVCMFLGQDVKAKKALEEATRLSGFKFVLSGALAKRTKWQEKSTSHLVVLARSMGEDKTGEIEGEKRPEALKLNDDTLLEELAFEKGEQEEGGKKEGGELPEELRGLSPDDQPQLSPLDQIILLAEATLKDSFSPNDTLTSEEVLPFAVRVISDKATNWQIYTHALLVRSRIEVHRSRTIERGVLQMQAVVDQVIVDTTQQKTGDEKRAEDEAAEEEQRVPQIQVTSEEDGESNEIRKREVNKPTSFFPAAKPDESAPAQVRLEFIHALSSPPRWHLECELAYSWANVGSIVSAMEIFKRLRLWAEVALCYASSAQQEDENGRGKGGEGKARAVLRWRLFNKTESSAEEQDGTDGTDEEDEYVDVDHLKVADYHGPERQPPAHDAPRLLCILGDIDNDPKLYERAWEISKSRFARAQKSLGEYYLQQKDIVKARDAYKKAIAVNRLSSELWNRLGDISLRIGDFSDAAEAFGHAISCSDSNGGEDARTWSNLGSSLYSLYVERVKELKKEREEGKVEEVKPREPAKDEEEDISAPEKPTKEEPSALLAKSLAAYKKGASISHDNWRIWDNVITLASRMRPIAVQDVLLALQHMVRIRNTEDALDMDVLRLLLNDAVLSKEKPEGNGPYDPSRGSVERSVCEFLEKSVVPLITTRSELWELITRERVWKRDFTGAVDAAEKAWRAAMGGAGSGGLSVGAPAADGKSKNWLEDKEAWKVVVERTDDLVSVLENYGEEVPAIGSKWKGKARLAVRSVMGKGKEAWEGGEEWERLVGLMEELKA